MKKIKQHEKMQLVRFDFLTETEKDELVQYISNSISKLIGQRTLYLKETNIFISYIMNLNTFNIEIMGSNTFYTSSIQTITHYIEKEFDKIRFLKGIK